MAWSTPKVWTSETLTSSDLNTYVSDNLSYLKGVADGVAFSGTEVTRSASTSINDSTVTNITWSAETFDYGGWFSSGTDIIVPSGAIPSGFTTIAVLITARTKFAANGTGIRYISVLKNGSEISTPSVSALSGEVTEIDTTRFTTASAADTFRLAVYQNSGGALSVSGTILSVVRFLPAA